MMGSIENFIEKYAEFVPEFLVAALVAFLLTPLIGKLAQKLNIVDLPPSKRSREDTTKDRRIHTTTVPQLGGVAILVAFAISIAIFDQVPENVYGILAGLAIMLFNGVLDDKFNLSAKTQLFFQILAGSIVIISGVTIADVSIMDKLVNLSLVEVDTGIFDYILRFPADLITLAWILVVTNALAWVCGIDALGESITLIATLTFAGIAVGMPGAAIYTSILFMFAGALFGFIPYNFPNAKIFGGAVGDMSLGFFLSTIVIASGISGLNAFTIVMILAVPILDMIWVLIYRIKNNKLSSPMSLLSISDKTHLHHRIMALGFSKKETLYLELVVFSIFALIAFYLGGRSTDIIVFTSTAVVILVTFAIIGVLYRYNWRKKKDQPAPKKDPISYEDTPEERYAY